MMRIRPRHGVASWRLVPLAGLLTGVVLSAPVASQAQDALRPAVGKPLQKAQALAHKGQFPQALAQVNAAAAVSGKSANESLVIDEMRASIAQQSGDFKGAIAADEALIHTGMVPAATQQQLLMAEASSAYSLRDYAQTISAIQRYNKAGGRSPAMYQLLIQCYFLQKDYAHAGAAQLAQIDAEIHAGQTPPETQLQLLANCQIQTSDQGGLTQTMVRLVTYYPKPEYWAQLMHGLQANPKVPPSLQYDIDRLRLEVGLLTSTADFMDITELAVQAGLPVQALAVMDKGYASGALGHDPQAAREARLRALVVKTIADKKASIAGAESDARAMKDGDALLAVGYTYVDLGQAQKGIAIMKEAIAKGGINLPDAATLHLGLAYLAAGDKATAVSTLQSVTGTDGAADIAHLWLLRIGKS